jgi:hypothetical protein
VTTAPRGALQALAGKLRAQDLSNDLAEKGMPLHLQGLALNNSPMALMELVNQYGFALLKNAGLMFLVLAIADYGWMRWKTNEDLKMTKQEVKEEMKSQEGNAEVKGRRRQVARERIRRAMFANVKTADVVLVNPSHIAIAIKYDPAVAPAPSIVALGDRRVVGAEGLLRWTHPERGSVPAGEIVRIAEQRRLMPLLGEAMLDQALASARACGLTAT